MTYETSKISFSICYHDILLSKNRWLRFGLKHQAKSIMRISYLYLNFDITFIIDVIMKFYSAIQLLFPLHNLLYRCIQNLYQYRYDLFVYWLNFVFSDMEICAVGDHDYVVKPETLTVEEQLAAAIEHIELIENENACLKSLRFRASRFSDDPDMIRFITGFNSYALFQVTYLSLEPTADRMVTWAQAQRAKGMNYCQRGII